MTDTVAVAAHGLTKSFGKTTTMRVLVGLSRPDDGNARLLGEPSRLAAGVLARVGVAGRHRKWALQRNFGAAFGG